MIRHLVMWKINAGIDNPEGLEIASKIQNDFAALFEQLDCVERIEVQINDQDSPKGNHDIVLISDFQSYDHMQQYLQSPQHIDIVKYLKEHTSGRTAIDYLV